MLHSLSGDFKLTSLEKGRKRERMLPFFVDNKW